MVKMASLKTGALLKLLEDVKMDGNDASEDDPKPVLLQIRGIIPVLEEGDLWPNRGFFLKVSDLSHSLYVTLSEEQNEMILGNKFKLGQFIYVQKLEKANPVPLLRGVTPVPGRRPCEGTPIDIVSPERLVKLLHAPAVDSVVEEGLIMEKKVSRKSPHVPRKLMRGSSASESYGQIGDPLKGGYEGRSCSVSASEAGSDEMAEEKCKFATEDFEETNHDDAVGWPRSRAASADNDSDVEGVTSSASSTRMSKRRSWNESEILRVKEILNSSVVKQETKLPPRRLCAHVSSVRLVKYGSSDDNSSSSSTRRVAGYAKRLFKSPDKGQVRPPKINDMQMSNSSLCSLVCERKGAGTKILWNSLPPDLVMLGKDVIRQREVALLASAAALQEACASERLLNCLSTLSQFPLAEGDDVQQNVEKLLRLQDDLARSRSIIQSLTSTAAVETRETELCSNHSVKETLERKKNAITWIKSAIAHDLSPSSVRSPSTNPANSMNTPKKTSPSSRTDKTDSSTADIISASNREDQPEWSRGSTLCTAVVLATSLQEECRKLFLSYVEKYLDQVEQRISSTEYSNVGIARMIGMVKMVSDSLDTIANKGSNPPKEWVRTDCECFGDSDVARDCGRVRNKIYEVLLKHAEGTAWLLNVYIV